MKAMKQGWVTLILTLMPLTVSAQEHVEQAFNDFLKSKNITFKETHSKSSNPETLQKASLPRKKVLPSVVFATDHLFSARI